MHATERERTSLRKWIGGFTPPCRRRRQLSEIEKALVGAQGKALTLLVTALEAGGHLDVEEFANKLGIFSVVVGEADDLQGAMLATWAGLMRESVIATGPIVDFP